jgi:hypothetical protein
MWEPYTSIEVGARPMLEEATSGLNQTCRLRKKCSLYASLTIRGNVTSPTHHQPPMNRSISRTLNFLGSSGLPTVFTRATTFANSFDDLRVIVLSMTGTNEPGEGKGFRAWSTYVPFRELNGDTWKSFIQMSVNLFFDTSSAGDSEPGVLPELGGVEPSSKYMRLSPNVLLTSRIIFLRS